MKIFLDPGHNYAGVDTGAAANGLREQEISFWIAEKLSRLLQAAGYEVNRSRRRLADNLGASTVGSLAKRCAIAEGWGADLFVSIHCNAGGGTGTETFVYSEGSPAVPYAEAIQAAICGRLGLKNRGVKPRPALYVLKHTTMPALLVETAFLDNESDAEKLRNRQADFAQAIFEGLTGARVPQKGERKAVAQTVMKLPGEVYLQEIAPADFAILPCDCPKRQAAAANYFNAGFFAGLQDGRTVPVGNLAHGGEILAQAKDNPAWLNTAGKRLTTVYTTKDGRAGLLQTDDLAAVPDLCEAVSGVPILRNGRRVSMEEIRGEGYFGSELYDTWHGFLGLRGGRLLYIAMRCGFETMCWALAALGVSDAVKLDGGGSFILKNGREIAGTGENRRIHNVGVWK